MDENILIKSEHYQTKKVYIICVAIAAIIAIILCISLFVSHAQIKESLKEYYATQYEEYEDDWDFYQEAPYKYPGLNVKKPDISDCYHIRGKSYNSYSGKWSFPSPSEIQEVHPDRASYVQCALDRWENQCSGDIALGVMLRIAIPLAVALLCLLFHWLLITPSITITDKRIYGKSIFGKQLDLPLDKIASVGMVSTIKGISIATSAGTVRLSLVKNYAEMHNMLCNLIMKKQETD